MSRRYRSVECLAPVDAAYIAGLIDGEGTVSLSRRHANERRQLIVSIANTERPLLQFVLDCVGAGKITSKRTVAAHHTASAVYCISNRQALSLLHQLYPYLRSHKRERTRLVLEKYIQATPRNGKYTPEIDSLRKALESEFFSVTSGACRPKKGAPLAI